jgi:CheY-like chemotaxis protein
MTLREREILEIERGNTRLSCMENWLWKKLWNLRKPDCILMDIVMEEVDCVLSMRYELKTKKRCSIKL